MAHRDRIENPLEVKRTVEGERRAGTDLAWIVVLGVLACVAAIYWSVPDNMLDRLDAVDRWNVNGILALVVVLPTGATAYAVRRYRDAVGAQRELKRLSLHDALTGLPNRRHLREVLPDVLAHARRHNTRSAVLFVDLDGFKAVNDTYGHEVGDRLMNAVGQRMQESVGAGRFVARYAGDEFVIVDPTPATVEQGMRLGRDIVNMIEVPFDLGEDRIGISASVGVAFGEAQDEPDSIIRDADAAMFEAKTTRSGAAVFEPVMRGRLTPANAERRLEEALERGEFRLFYQPMVTLRDARLVGVEALLRWADPDRGVLTPSEFLIPLEDTGLIVPVGRWILHEACRQARRWADAAPDGSTPVRVSVNVSPRQLAQSDFVDVIQHAIDSSGVNPTQIYLELSEDVLASDVRLAWATLGEARQTGVGLALDNFGTGYSSISHLRSFDLELVKLDRSYVEGLGRSPQDDAIVRHIVALARSLGIATLAEGVADERRVRQLLEVGCELGQGEYFAHAQPDHVIDQLIVRTASPSPVATPSDAAGGGGTVVLPDLRKT